MSIDWTTQEACLARMVYDFEQAKAFFDMLMPDCDWIQEAIDAGNALLACQRIKYALYRVQNVFSYMIDWQTGYTPNAIIPYYFTNYVGVTWKSIVEAWVKDDFEGRAWTIGVIDRMRQMCWDEPFDLTWAAKPEDGDINEP